MPTDAHEASGATCGLALLLARETQVPAAAGEASNWKHGEKDMWLATHDAGGNSHIQFMYANMRCR